MKKIISIILAFIFLIQIMVFIPSCFIKSDYVGEYVIKKLLNKNYMIERLYGEKQEEINGKTMLTVDDFIELFDIDFYIILHYDLDGRLSGSETIDVKDNVDREDSNNKTCAIMSYDTSDHKVIVCNKYIFNVYTSIEDAHAAYCSLIADGIEYREYTIPIKYRINNVVMWHTELDEVPISKVEYIDEMCELFNIDYKNEYISIETNNYLKEMKMDFSKMISYFENDDNYEVIKIKNGDLGTGVLDYKVWGYLNAYVISNKELDSYLVVKEFIENEEDADFYVYTFDHWFRYIQYYECNGILYYDNHLISSDNTIWLQRIINLHSKGYF